MEKFREEKGADGLYRKFYNGNDVTFSIDSLMESNPDVNLVSAEDMGDVGMRTFGGRYSFDEFATLYPEIRTKILTALILIVSRITRNI